MGPYPVVAAEGARVVDFDLFTWQCRPKIFECAKHHHGLEEWMDREIHHVLRHTAEVTTSGFEH